jgi:8-oxo-dGTP diphosphatase
MSEIPGQSGHALPDLQPPVCASFGSDLDLRYRKNDDCATYRKMALLGHVPCETVFAMHDQIARTVGALFISTDGKVLLGFRAPSKNVWPRHWDTIGGRVEDGESLNDALIREVQEEVGVTPTEFSLIATVKERQPEIYGEALHHVYAVTSWQGGDPANVCDEHTDLKWFSISEMRLLTNIVDSDYPLFAQIAMTGKAT